MLRVVDYHVDLGPLYPLLIYLVVAGTTSAVNLTDGLDGLAAGCAAIVLLAYIGITFLAGDFDMAMLAGCLVGGCIGFLWFNAFPATIFMGDTGSLGLGGAIAGLAVMTKTEVLLILIGGIFVIEALSVVIQVLSFQTTRRRVFLMAPIHHHFELRAWSETKIILRFWIVASIFAGDRLHDLPPEPRRIAGPGTSGGFRVDASKERLDAKGRSSRQRRAAGAVGARRARGAGDLAGATHAADRDDVPAGLRGRDGLQRLLGPDAAARAAATAAAYLVKFFVFGGVGLALMHVLARDGVAKVHAITAPLLAVSLRAGGWRCTSLTSASASTGRGAGSAPASCSSSPRSC